MREVRHSAVVPYSADEMFELVADVEAYADFVPGCTESCVESREPSEGGEEVVIATLGMLLAGHRGEFTTRNVLRRPESIRMSLLDGPFSTLEGEWSVEPLGEDRCRLDLHMRFEFAKRFLDRFLGPVFEMTCNHLVDAFVKRAKHLYD